MKSVLSFLSLFVTAAIPAAFVAPDPSVATVTTITTFPNTEAVNVAVVGKGRFIYLATQKGVILYDRSTKKSKIIAKDSYSVITGSPTGDRIALLRYVEGATAVNPQSLPWTIPLNPATGEPTGPARRVSMLPTNTMRISPNGKQIALVADGAQKSKVVLLSINGGVERVLSEDWYAAPLRWAPDGSALFVQKYTKNGAQVVRISVPDGNATIATPDGGSGAPGITPDGKFFIIWNAGNLNILRYSVFDASGRKHNDIQVKNSVFGWYIDDAWLNKGYHWVWALRTAPLVAHSADYRTGTSRVLQGIVSENLELSPNKSLIYSEEPDAKIGSWVAVVRTTNGSNAKRLGDMGRGFQAPLSSQWSPDGRYLLYRLDNGRSLMLYDVVSGDSRQLARADLVGQPHWRSDGKAAVYMAWESDEKLVVRETMLDGKTRSLRDVSAEPTPGAIEIIGDSIIYNRRNATVTFFKGPARQAFGPAPFPPAGPPAGGSPFFPSLSPDGKWLARTAPDRKGIDIVALDGSAKRKIPLSLNFVETLGVKFHPNGREVIVPVKSTADSRGGFVAVPLDGGSPRRIVTVGANESITTYSLSADGNTILYSTYGLPSVTLLDIDFGPGLPH